MANFSTVEGAQLFLNMHLRRNSYAYDFFNTGFHMYEDSSRINLELRLDNHLHTNQGVAKLHLFLLRVPDALGAFSKKEESNIYVDKCLQLNDDLVSFFSPDKNGVPNYQKIKVDLEGSSKLFSLEDIAQQTEQFNEFRSIYFKNIRRPGVPAYVGVEGYFFGNGYERKGRSFIKKIKSVKKRIFQ